MTTPTQITHPEGVALCERYLRDEKRCFPVLCEPTARSCDECPDAIGWWGPAYTIVLDWKCSLSDARAHLEKPFVQYPQHGVGTFRYLACEPHVVDEPEVADWPGGILWYDPTNGQWTERKSSPEFHRRSWVSENAILIATMANLSRAAGKSANDARKSAHNTLPAAHLASVKEYLADHAGYTAKQILRAVRIPTCKTPAALAKALEDAEGIGCDRNEYPRRFWLEELESPDNRAGD